MLVRLSSNMIFLRAHKYFYDTPKIYLQDPLLKQHL